MIDLKKEVVPTLITEGHYLTSFEELDLTFPTEAATELVDLAASHATPGLKIMAVDNKDVPRLPSSEHVKKLASTIADPLLKVFFSGERYAKARRDWVVFGVNYYDADAWNFGWHTDSPQSTEKTAVVIGLAGVRVAQIKKELGDNTYVSRRLEPQSVLLFDGYTNPWHKAMGREVPSASLVIDVPDIVRTD